MTAKTLRNTGSVDCTCGISREQRAINRRNKIKLSRLNKIESSRSKKTVSSRLSDIPYHLRRAIKTVNKHEAIQAALVDYEKRLCAYEANKFGKQLPDRDPNVIFKEKPFGSEVQFGDILCQTTANHTDDLTSIVVSLALFDGSKMVFACSGIPIPDGSAVIRLTRFVTSARLVREFEKNRNKKDALRVSVRLPNKTIAHGFLGLYDNDIAIVTCIGPLAVRPVEVDLWAKSVAVPSSHKIQAAGRAFRLTDMRTIDGYWSVGSSKTLVPCSEDFTEAVLGGAVIGNDARLLGMVLDLCLHGGENFKCASFLPLDDLYKRLQHFQILSPKQQSFQRYSTPPGVSTVIPSGFMKTSYRLESFGYPMPPPLVLELNGELRNRFEERFGQSLAWKGYPYGDPPCSSRERVWAKLKKTVVTDISRRVVSLASFNERDERYFACTGLLIKWPGSTAVLTSASLVREKKEDKIHPNLRIEVSLPPNQRANGKLEYFELNYNVAIISVEKNFSSIRPEDIFNEKKYSSKAIVQKASEKVFAIGRDIKFGPLMASAGEVNRSAKACKLDCEGLQVSTCKIKKVGIGGPLINFTGSFVGMNFYDGSQVTPFLPRSKIVEVLSRSYENIYPLPSKDDLLTPIDMEDGYVRGKNKWPVPEPYWYHGGLDVDRYDLPMPRGRTLH